MILPFSLKRKHNGMLLKNGLFFSGKHSMFVCQSTKELTRSLEATGGGPLVEPTGCLVFPHPLPAQAMRAPERH